MKISSTKWSHHQLFDNFVHEFIILGPQRFHVWSVHGWVRVTPRAEVLVNVVGLNLQDAYAMAVEPIWAPLTTDVKSGNKLIVCRFEQNIGGSATRCKNKSSPNFPKIHPKITSVHLKSENFQNSPKSWFQLKENLSPTSF